MYKRHQCKKQHPCMERTMNTSRDLSWTDFQALKGTKLDTSMIPWTESWEHCCLWFEAVCPNDFFFCDDNPWARGLRNPPQLGLLVRNCQYDDALSSSKHQVAWKASGGLGRDCCKQVRDGCDQRQFLGGCLRLGLFFSTRWKGYMKPKKFVAKIATMERTLPC